MTTGWQRLHPLSPVVRLGRAGFALVVLVLPALSAGGGHGTQIYADVAVVALLVVGGVVNWAVTRWRIEGGALRIETGLVRRSSRRYPLQQIQAIDVVRPGLARLLGLAELRLRMGGSTRGHARLAYLREQEAEEVRARLLRLASGAADEHGPIEETLLFSVPTPRLVASMLLTRAGLLMLAFLAAVVALGVTVPSARAAVGATAFVEAVSVVHLVLRRFNNEYRLSVAEAPDGLRVRAGLVGLTAETIPRGRVQAVRLHEPLLWRPFGWVRLELDLAGRQRTEGEGAAAGKRLRVVLPAGTRRLAQGLLERLLPDVPAATLRPPARARWKSPLRFRHLAWGSSETCVVASTGRVARTTVWAPLEKVQSLRRVQGPVQRRLRLASVHLDTAGRNVHAVLRDRDEREADDALAELTQLARTARRPARPRSATKVGA